MDKRLIDHVFRDLVTEEEDTKEDLLAMMEMYGLIAKFPVKESSGEDTVCYFVPAQLTSSPEDLSRLEPCNGDPCLFFIHFLHGFVPHGLFPQLVSRLIHWCSNLGCTALPNLYCNAVRCILGSVGQFDLILWCSQRFIKVVLRTSLPGSSGQVRSVMLASIPLQVRSFLEQTLLDLKHECCWLGNMEYQVSVSCAACAACDKPCQQHGVVSCPDDDCLHLVPVINGSHPSESLVCPKMFGANARFVVPGLKQWYLVEIPKVFLLWFYNFNFNYYNYCNYYFAHLINPFTAMFL